MEVQYQFSRGLKIYSLNLKNKKSGTPKEYRFNDTIEHESVFECYQKSDSVNTEKHLGV